MKIDTILQKELKLFGKNKSLLFVDDDSITRKIVFKSLDGYFEKMVLAEDGNDALAKYKKEKFDVVITDINMPNMNGLEFITKMHDNNPEQLVIVLSSTSDVEYFIELLNLGVDGFVLKPFGFRKLAKKIIQTLESLYYKKLLFDLKKEKIILEYKHKQRIEELQKETVEQKIKDKEIKEKTDDILKKYGTMVTGQLSAIEFFDRIKDEETSKVKINNIISNVKHLLVNISDLLVIADNLYYQLDSDNAMETVNKVAQAFLMIFHSINEFEMIKDLSEPFYLFFDFFDDYQYIDTLDKDEVKELLSISFIAEDLEVFLKDIFIEKTAENIFIYKDLFTQSLEQLESNVQNICRDMDDGELDFF